MYNIIYTKVKESQSQKEDDMSRISDLIESLYAT